MAYWTQHSTSARRVLPRHVGRTKYKLKGERKVGYAQLDVGNWVQFNQENILLNFDSTVDFSIQQHERIPRAPSPDVAGHHGHALRHGARRLVPGTPLRAVPAAAAASPSARRRCHIHPLPSNVGDGLLPLLCPSSSLWGWRLSARRCARGWIAKVKRAGELNQARIGSCSS